MDHFGSKDLRSKHLNYLIEEQGNIIFWSKLKKRKTDSLLLNQINLQIGFFKKFNKKIKKNVVSGKEFMPGDTDTFINLN